MNFTMQNKWNICLVNDTYITRSVALSPRPLFLAVVNHHGARAIGGHYTTDVFHPGVNGWIRMDDSGVKHVSEKNVLKQQAPTVPYLLYYRSSDTT